MHPYAVCVIGAGPSGYAAAMRAADFGLRTALIEKSRIGGAGLHDGALSSKTFWEISREWNQFCSLERKRGRTAPDISFREVREEVEAAVSHRETQMHSHLSFLGNAVPFDFIRGEAGFETPHRLRFGPGADEVLEADHFVLATGSRPRAVPGIEADEEIILTSDGIGRLAEFPESLVILGAGVIGCEFASIFANFGKTKVFLIDKAERILPFEDADLAAVIDHNLEARGVTIHRGARLLRMEKKNGQVEYELEFSGGRREVHHVQKALVSVGRVPNVESLQLQNAGVKVDARNHVLTHDTRSMAPHIFAVGDLTADIALVNVGELEGRHAVEIIMGKSAPIVYDNISTIMFLCPEVAGVGMNEQQAVERGIPHKVVSIDYSCIPRAIAMRQTQGFFKLIVRADDHRVLGMRAVGEHASSAIQAVALLIALDQSAAALSELIHPHPSIIEGIQECARMLEGKSIFKPAAMQNGMRYAEWMPVS